MKLLTLCVATVQGERERELEKSQFIDINGLVGRGGVVVVVVYIKKFQQPSYDLSALTTSYPSSSQQR